ncbi:hypothetical protein QUA71_06975 [Microcoleus sp. MON1_C5]|uniref:hypothetical protein n=1 Tax=Microcoleus sp. MON1_C5 TaxID=2818828 RepID=UPI002FD649F0
MPGSQIWTVKAPVGTDIAAFNASKALYAGAIGTAAGIVAIGTAAARATPVYEIGELVRVGWLVPINVSVATGTGNRRQSVTVYCSGENANSFVNKCRTNPSGLLINGKEVVSATYRTKQTLS